MINKRKSYDKVKVCIYIYHKQKAIQLHIIKQYCINTYKILYVEMTKLFTSLTTKKTSRSFKQLTCKFKTMREARS